MKKFRLNQRMPEEEENEDAPQPDHPLGDDD